MDNDSAHDARGSADLATTYLGLQLQSPIVASSSPLTGKLEGIRALAAAGVGAIVLPSVFEEEIWNETRRLLDGGSRGIGRLARVSERRPAEGVDAGDPADTLGLLRAASAEVDVPLIASINGGEAGGWPAYAHALQQAGARAIELNVFEVPAGADASARAIEDRHLELLATVKSVVTVPVAVKLAPWLTAPGELGARLVGAGADGLVLFNRFMQPDIDIQQLSIVSRPQLSSPWEARLPMTWIALLRGRIPVSLAATTGVAGPSDVIKYLLAGADVVMTASAVLRCGPSFVGTLNDGLRDWMVEHGYDTVAEVRGRLQRELAGDAASKRAAYLEFIAEGEREFG